MTTLSTSQICTLIQTVTGAGAGRAASKEVAAKRFLKATEEKGIYGPAILQAETFEAAEAALAAAMRPEPAAAFEAPADELRAQTTRPQAATEEDEGIPEFLLRGQRAREASKPAAAEQPALETKKGKAAPLTLSDAETAAVEAGIAAYAAAADRSDDMIREMLREAFQAGVSAKARKVRAAKKVKTTREPGAPSKKEVVKNLLLRPEGTTAAEIMAATGWPSVSVPQQARSAGLTLRMEKDGRSTRYFATEAAQEAA
jgi:hypothetical protein